jgi:hypothetical protein
MSPDSLHDGPGTPYSTRRCRLAAVAGRTRSDDTVELTRDDFEHEVVKKRCSLHESQPPWR